MNNNDMNNNNNDTNNNNNKNNNGKTIDEAIDILMASTAPGAEECAMAIHDLRAERDLAKGIALDRLERIGKLQNEVAVLEDKLENARSALRESEAVVASGRALVAAIAVRLRLIDRQSQRAE